VSEGERVIRLAAKGDGITASGRHVAGSAPGDFVHADGTVVHGPEHVTPPCRHFGTCGGCELQYVSDAELARFVRERVDHAAAGQGLVPGHVSHAAMSPPESRRRGSLQAINGGGKPLIGFAQRGSHRLVDLRECHILLPELFALLAPFRTYFGRLKGKYSIGIEMALTDQGVAIALANFAPEGLVATEDLLDFCRDNGLARLSVDHGFGPEAFWEPEPVTLTLGGVRVAYPAGAFMQATAHGEAALVSAARAWLADCTAVADLFSGLGTFAFALTGKHKVLAVEAEKAALLALKMAAAKARLPIEGAHRDLFRNPMRPEELAGFDGVLLDPPRAGARAQIEQLTHSRVARIVYISCNPSSWSRDGALLAAAGYDLREVRPVGQFRWSTHVELASLFVKRGEDGVG